MCISTEINPLFESVIMLGRYVSARDISHFIGRMSAEYGDEGIELFKKLSKPLIELQNKMLDAIDCSNERLEYLFGRLDAFPKGHPIGCSVATIVLSEDLLLGSTSIHQAKDKLNGLSIDARIKRFSYIITSGRDDGLDENATTVEFMEYVNRLEIPVEQKWKIINTILEFDSYAEEICKIVEMAEHTLTENIVLASELISEYKRTVTEHGDLIALVESRTHSAVANKQNLLLRPSLFTYDGDIMLSEGTSEPSGGRDTVYLSVLRPLFLQAETFAVSPIALVRDAKVIADRSRLEIMSYLKENSAYGQELADRFGLFSTTVSHHMAKLMGSGFVYSTLQGTKSIYSLDKERIDAFLTNLRRYLVE